MTEPREIHLHPHIGRATKVHNIWQVDAKERLQLQDGSQACYLTITDEHTGSWLCAIAFPYSYISQVPLMEVQTALIKVFARWGKAGAFRVDNGAPFGNPKMSSTPPIALWLIAHDVDMIWNKPRSPQCNAKVERMQATSSRWVNVSDCPTREELQKRLDQEAIIQREKYPVKRLQNKTRLQVFPELETSRRPYESTGFDPTRVYEFLAKKTYVRTTDKTGRLMIYNIAYNLSAGNRKKVVNIKLLTSSLHWQFYIDGQIVGSQKAENLSPDRILNLTVCQ